MKKSYILGQRVDGVSLEDVFNSINEDLRKKRKNLYFALNINILNSLNLDPVFRKIHERRAKYIYADGVPIVWLSWLTDCSLRSRVSGTDLVEKILRESGARVFILGGHGVDLKKAAHKFPTVCGFYAPPFGKGWQERERSKIIKKIMVTKAEVLLVALGPLKQEKWLVDNFYSTGAYVGLGVGSALEILVGSKPRAPQFLQKIGCEWLWRILLEPGRLAPRYFFDTFHLLRISINQFLNIFFK